MPKARPFDNNHFRQFAVALEGAILGHETDEDHYTRQKRQVETLCKLEREFRNALIRDHRGPAVYKAFVKYVRDERRNILSARPYFRERQDVFKAKIAPALRDRGDKALYKFDINYNFIAFVMKAKPFAMGSKVAKLSRKVAKARQELIEMNIPLAISRARVFARYRQQHLEYMDLVQVATEGLIAAIDKFVLPYQKSFGAVMWGRITGDLVETNSETLVHFYPSDKRIIYTVNKLVQTGMTFEQIADHINLTAKTDEAGVVHKSRPNVTNADEVQRLYVASYTVSGDSAGGDTDDSGSNGIAHDESPIHRFEADESWRPDVRYEQAQLSAALAEQLKDLSIIERKLLALKGVMV